MAIASAKTRVPWAGVACGPILGIAVASIALVAGVVPPAAAGRERVSSAYALIPAQLSMGRPGFTKVPPVRKSTTTATPATPATPGTALTPQEQKRIADMMGRMSPKDRKRLLKSVKRMTPEQRQRFVAILKQQLAKQGPAAATKRAR